MSDQPEVKKNEIEKACLQIMEQHVPSIVVYSFVGPSLTLFNQNQYESLCAVWEIGRNPNFISRPLGRLKIRISLRLLAPLLSGITEAEDHAEFEADFNRKVRKNIEGKIKRMVKNIEIDTISKLRSRMDNEERINNENRTMHQRTLNGFLIAGWGFLLIAACAIVTYVLNLPSIIALTSETESQFSAYWYCAPVVVLLGLLIPFLFREARHHGKAATTYTFKQKLGQDPERMMRIFLAEIDAASASSGAQRLDKRTKAMVRKALTAALSKVQENGASPGEITDR